MSKIEFPISREKLTHKNILCVDMKAFYASIEAVARNLDPLKTYLAVVGDKDRKTSVVLAASPALKEKYNIKTGNRLYEIPKKSEINIVEARMGLYVKKSCQITNLFNQFVPITDIFVYSIDEAWLDLEGTEKLWGNKLKTSMKIKQSIYDEYGLLCSMGLGPNMFLAKVAMDVEGKKKGLVEWNYDDIPQKLWPLKLGDCWGIGSRLEKKFNKIGIKTVGELAHLSLDYLEKKFGIMGAQLYYHAWGIDYSKVEGEYEEKPKNISRGITLYEDYKNTEKITTVIFELGEEVASRVREQNLIGKTVSLTVVYSHNELKNGFSRQHTLQNYTNLNFDIYEACLILFQENYGGEAVRKISISLGNFISDSSRQLNLFQNKNKYIKLAKLKDKLNKKYNHKALFYGKSLKNGSIRNRINTTIGGHSG